MEIEDAIFCYSTNPVALDVLLACADRGKFDAISEDQKRSKIFDKMINPELSYSRPDPDVLFVTSFQVFSQLGESVEPCDWSERGRLPLIVPALAPSVDVEEELTDLGVKYVLAHTSQRPDEQPQVRRISTTIERVGTASKEQSELVSKASRLVLLVHANEIASGIGAEDNGLAEAMRILGEIDVQVPEVPKDEPKRRWGRKRKKPVETPSADTFPQISIGIYGYESVLAAACRRIGVPDEVERPRFHGRSLNELISMDEGLLGPNHIKDALPILLEDTPLAAWISSLPPEKREFVSIAPISFPGTYGSIRRRVNYRLSSGKPFWAADGDVMATTATAKKDEAARLPTVPLTTRDWQPLWASEFVFSFLQGVRSPVTFVGNELIRAIDALADSRKPTALTGN